MKSTSLQSKQKIMNQLRLAVAFIILSLFTTFTVENQASDIIILPVEGVDVVEWSPDGTMLALGTFPEIQIWDAETWELIVTIPESYSWSIAWHPNSTQIATVRGGCGETLTIQNATTGEITREDNRMLMPNAPYCLLFVRDLAWHPDGNQIYSENPAIGESLSLWDLNAEKMPSIFGETPDSYSGILSLEISNDGRYLLTNGAVSGDSVPFPFLTMSMVRMWDAETGDVLFQTRGVNVAWGPNDEMLLVHNDLVNPQHLHINIWNYEQEQILTTYSKNLTGLIDLSWNYHDNIIATTDLNNILTIWDAETSETYFEQVISAKFFIYHDWRPNSNQLAYSTWDEVVIRTFDF